MKSHLNLRPLVLVIIISVLVVEIIWDLVEITYFSHLSMAQIHMLHRIRGLLLGTIISLIALDYVQKKFHEEQKLLKSELEEKYHYIEHDEEKFHTILDSLPIGVDIVDKNHNILYMNKFLLDRYGEEALGKRCHSIFAKKNYACDGCPLHTQYFDTKGSSYIVHNSDGYIYRINHAKLSSFEGQEAVVEVIEDLTEEHKTKEALDSKSKQVDQLKEENVKLRQMCEISPQIEDDVTDGKKMTLAPKKIYIVPEEQPNQVFSIFSNLVRHGTYGLAITRHAPDEIKTQFKLLKTPFIRLTTTPQEDEEFIEPNSLSKITNTIFSFLDKTDESVILLDGLEYLITQNGFDSVLKLVQFLDDKIMVSNSRVLLSIDPLAFDERQYHILRHECEVFNMPKKENDSELKQDTLNYTI